MSGFWPTFIWLESEVRRFRSIIVGRANRRFFIQLALGRVPAVYILVARFRRHKAREDKSPFKKALVSRATDIVIEGYPRSANTFLTVKFMLATKFSYNVAHHYHTPVQVIEGVRNGAVCVVIIRDPIGAIASFLKREPTLSPSLAVAHYSAFYERILPLLDKVAIVTFEQVTQNSGAVIEHLVQVLDRSVTVEGVSNEDIFHAIEERSAYNNKGLFSEERVPRPSGQRDMQSIDIANWGTPETLDRCLTLYKFLSTKAIDVS